MILAIDVLVTVWLLGVLFALLVLARGLDEVPPPGEAPALVAVILAVAWPATLVVLCVQYRRQILGRVRLWAWIARALWGLLRGFRRWNADRAADAERFRRGDRFKGPTDDDFVDDPSRGWRLTGGDGSCLAHPWIGANCIICGKPAGYPTDGRSDL